MSAFAQILEQAFQRRVADEESRSATPLQNALNYFENGFARLPFEESAQVLAQERPAWAVALQLELPCTVQELKRAFRRQALKSHPDRPGGSHEAFLRTTALFEEAMAYLKSARATEPRLTSNRVGAQGYSRRPQVSSSQVIAAYV